MKKSENHTIAELSSIKTKILQELFLKEELKGEQRSTFFILAVLLPAMFITIVVVAFISKFTMNSMFNLALALVYGLYYSLISILLKRRIYRPFMKYVSVGVNITALTAALAGYSLHSGWLHTMHTTVLSAYILAIVVAGLYQNPAVPLFAGGLSIAAYGAIALYGIFVAKVPIAPIETFTAPAYSYDVMMWDLSIFAFIALVMSSLNRNYRKMLERSLSSEAYSKVVRRANAQKTNFFINLAHETKTPLTLISNYMEDFAEKHRDEPEISLVREYVEKLRHDMVNFLDFEKLKKGIVFYDHERIANASRSLETHCFLFKELASRKGIGFSSEIDEKAFIRIDPSALDRVFGNLIDNAVKFTERGGSVKVSLVRKAPFVDFAVEDTGPGIPAQLQKAIFKPFFQLSHEKRNIQGMGMGLAIVKRIVDGAGGRISIESSLASGTRFSISLPLAHPSGQDGIVSETGVSDMAVPAAEAELLPQGDAVDKPQLFIVEDNKALLRYLQGRLSQEYNIRYALDGAEALEALRSPPRPDIILSDIMMDGMDGYDFRDRLVEIGELASVPFVFVTALASFKHKMQGLRKGAIDYIYKPFHIDELTQKLRSIRSIQEALSERNMAELGRRLDSRFAAGRGVGTGNAEPETGRAPSDALGEAEKLVEKSGISTRQLQIAALLKVGLERKEIGQRLGISLNTVNTQIRRMFDKCGVNNRVELLNILSEDNP
jgi:signal transduction histidine kinase/DNA-binding NarL/FixJ family response regulator